MKKVIYWTVIAVLVAVFIYSGYSLISYYADSQKSEQAYEELAQLVVDRPTIPLPKPSSPAATEPVETEPEQVLITVRDPKTGGTTQVLPEYIQLYTRNSDLVGWLSIDGTKINYPVMQTGIDRPNYYLERSFEKKYSVHGSIYINEAADVFKPSDNLTFYGHRMSDDSMFAQLSRYTDKAFWESHQYIRFDSLRERHLYQVICVFSTSAYEGEGFLFNRFVDAADEGDFDTFVQQCQALSYYDTGITAQFGDKLITLCTCEYTHDNGRLVVVAKRIG